MIDRMRATTRILTTGRQLYGFSALVAAALVLSGCATSISGSQEPITADDLHNPALVCPLPDDFSNFDKAATPENRRTIRDRAVANCVAAIDAKYIAFKKGLRSDYVQTNVITDVLSLGLTGASALTKADAAKEFAQAALFASGVRDTVNADVFFKQTLPAIEATMDANRDTILKNIIQSEKDDGNTTGYTLNQASTDLLAYQRAGDLDAAINTLNKTANAAAAAAATAVTQQQVRHYVTCALDPGVQAGENQIMDWLHGNATDTTLKALAAKVAIDPGTYTGQDLAGRIAGSMDDTLRSAPCTQAAQQAALKPFTDAFTPYMQEGN